MKSKYLLLLSPIVAIQVQATTILFEDFEDSSLTYTINVAEDVSDMSNLDYFGRIAPDTTSPPSSLSYQNGQGSGYFGAQDTNGVPSGSPTNIVLSFLGLDITGLLNLSFEGFFAEDNASDGNEDWDANSSLVVSYQIDTSGFQKLFAIETDTDATNQAPAVDDNFDGTGEGTKITDTFTKFTRSIAGTGTTLDLLIEMNGLDAGDEDIAFDNIKLSGASGNSSVSAKSVPDSHGFLLLPLSLASLALINRKRNSKSS